MEKVAEDDYRASAKSITVLGNTISAATTGKVLEKVGEQVETEFFGSEATLDAPRQAPANPVSLLLLSSDGSRYRTNEADRRRGDKPRPKTGAALAAEDELELEGLTDGERDRGWRENKIGIVARALRGSYDAQGRYVPPEELLKTYVATVGNIERFGRLFRTEAERRGLLTALEIVWVGDHGHGNPGMLEREFAELAVHIITDFYHTSERLAECAKIIEGEGPHHKRQRQKLFQQLRSGLWNGNVTKVIQKLCSLAETRAPRPGKLSELADQPALKTLWLHIFYLEKYQHTMDYPAYRAKGWPMGSGVIESACGQFGDRVKHTRMRWTRRHADALHSVKAAIFSQDERWQRRWPPPIQILELRAAS
jgi:hypothetical protein